MFSVGGEEDTFHKIKQILTEEVFYDEDAIKPHVWLLSKLLRLNIFILNLFADLFEVLNPFVK